MGKIALYTKPSAPNDQRNSGLFFNKFCNTWKSDWTLATDSGHESPKYEWLRKFAHLQGNNEKLTEAIIRRQYFLEQNNGKFLTVKTQGSFVTGMGNPHPVENGFTWHHTLGTPYLPGSSVKGLVRDWAENWLEEKQKILQIFGSEKKDGKGERRVGSVIFMDALPTKQVKLKVEIMTPHYAKYYQDDTGKTAPGDWLSPTPIPFLAVDENQEFQFSILPRRWNNEDDKNDVAQVISWLEEALKILGAGAKTATGYGIMRTDKSLQEEQEREQEKKKKETLNQAVQWLDDTLERLRSDKDLKGQPEENLWKKALSVEWQVAQPSSIKPAVLGLIRDKWKELKIDWSNPDGSSAKIAKRNFDKGDN